MGRTNLALAEQTSQENHQPAWWYADGEAAIGPVTQEQLQALIANGRVEEHTYIFHHDFGTWTLLSDAWQYLGTNREELKRSKRIYVENLGLNGCVYAHNGEALIVARPLNLSTTGMFILTEDFRFQLGETLTTTIKVPGLLRPMNIRCEVMRIERRDEYQPGYGLRFCEPHEQLERLTFRLM